MRLKVLGAQEIVEKEQTLLHVTVPAGSNPDIEYSSDLNNSGIKGWIMLGFTTAIRSTKVDTQIPVASAHC